jgi:soluble lytic murein transglycosylase-like protein
MADLKNSLGPDIVGTPFDSQINAAAHTYELRPALLAAVVEQESHFNPSATSRSGAQGLAQLMPDLGGAKYLSRLLEIFDSDERLALAAYNAGPGTVQKYGSVPPFRETRDYVEGVEAKAPGHIAPSHETVRHVGR